MEKDLFHEIIKYGNPYNLIKYKLIDHNMYIEYIINNRYKYSEKQLLIALNYSIKTMPNYMYEGKGLIEYFIDYPKIVKYMYLCKGIKNEIDTNFVINIEDIIISDSVNNEYFAKIEVKDDELVFLIFSLYCEKKINYIRRVLPSNEYIEYLVMTDNTEILKKEEYDVNTILNRIEYLNKYAQNYYKLIASFYFYIIFESITVIQNINEDMLPKIIKYFPKQLGIEGIKIDPYYYRFFTYPITYRTYLLGFDPLLEYPSDEEIRERYLKLQSTNLNTFISDILCDNIIDDMIANPHDTLFENPEEYLPFDRVNVNENGKIYRFTRNEFDILLNKGCNFWTKQPLSISSYINLGIKINIAAYLQLPPAAPLEELFEKAINGCLIPEQEEQEK